jgi:hypothetical protein
MVGKMFSPQFFKESISNVGVLTLIATLLLTSLLSSVAGSTTVRYPVSICRKQEVLILCAVLVDSWGQCKDADVLLESPSAMAGIHIAEALRKFSLRWPKSSS